MRDDGERLAVSSQADRAGVVVWWRRCAWRWNAMASALPVSGSVEFKAAAIRAAVDVQRPITFADPALESRRQAETTRPRPSAGLACHPSARSHHQVAGTACTHSASPTRCALRPSGRCKRRPSPPRRRRRPKCSSRPGPRRPNWNSARRGYGRRWRPRRRNARTRAMGAVDDCAVACILLECNNLHHNEVLKHAIRYRPKCA
ncbi:LPD7 domain-containing protein [Verminephrobacter eiseniae]|uniref:LPD7 domain-containing protein n=1 Tax=Verminephrobacter eiseniae TaxID=364317 RepID=UPI0038B4153C